MKHVRVAVGVLTKDNAMLIAERPKHKPYSGYWEFPGGKLQDDETDEQALHRELHEELGVVVRAATHLFKHTYDYTDSSVELSVWHVSQFDGEPIGREQQALEWVTFASIMNFHLLPGNWVILNQLQQTLTRSLS